VRKAIEDIGGTMPEELPAPADSIQQLEQKEKKRLKQGPQASMFDEEN
jgi:DNA-damage-inducible protein D